MLVLAEAAEAVEAAIAAARTARPAATVVSAAAARLVAAIRKGPAARSRQELPEDAAWRYSISQDRDTLHTPPSKTVLGLSL